MKRKLLLGLALVGFMSVAIALNEVKDRQFIIKLNNKEVNMLGQALNNAKIAIDKSDIPTNQGIVAKKEIDSISVIIGKQIQEQLKDSVKKDTIKKTIPKKKH